MQTQTPRHLTWLFRIFLCLALRGEIMKGLLDCKAPGVLDRMPDTRADVDPLTGIFPLSFVSYQRNGSILSRWRNWEQRKYSAMICVTQCTLCVVMENEMKIMNRKSLIRVVAIWFLDIFICLQVFYFCLLVKTCPNIKYMRVKTHFRIWNAFDTSHSCWYYHTQKLKGISKVLLICVM